MKASTPTPLQAIGLPSVSWDRRTVTIAVAMFAAANLGVAWAIVRPGPHNGDWQLWTAVADALGSGTGSISIYDVDQDGLRFVWSVPAGYFMAAVVSIGYWPWVGLHYAALGLLWRTPVIAVLAALSWPLWTDAMEGNTFTFAFVAGVLAVQGSRWGSAAFVALTVLIPRPVCLPLAAWLLWRQPWLRLPATTFGLIVLAISWPQLAGWVAAIEAYEPPFNMSPTRWFGRWWFVIGVPLAAWLTWRRWLGGAGLAVSPYLMPYYLLMPLLDHVMRKRSGERLD